eukprot:g2866.t1
MSQFSQADVGKHSTESDCWVTVHGKVYDVTNYLDEHPGGPEIIMDLAGKDASEEFEDIGHSADAREQMTQFLKGEIEGYVAKEKAPAGESGGGSANMMVPLLHKKRTAELRTAQFSANPAKRVKEVKERHDEESKAALASEGPSSMIVQFQAMDGDTAGPQIDVAMDTTAAQMEVIVNELLQNDEKVPYAFYVDDDEMMSDLRTIMRAQKRSTERALTIRYQPLSVFRVRTVTRCTHTLPGHAEAILHVSFSPDGNMLATGGGDATVRFWDVHMATPLFTCKGHKHHVLATSWSPDGKRFASGDKDGVIKLWDPKTGEECGKGTKKHRKWVSGLCWEPHHRNAACERFLSCSKDHTAKVWNARTGRCETTLCSHTDSVECAKWGGSGLIYTASRDRQIKVWAVSGPDNDIVQGQYKLVRTLTGHAHRINTLALSCDYVCRTGAYEHAAASFATAEAAHAAAVARYEKLCGDAPERLVSGSDDFTLFFWTPLETKKPVARLTGHCQAVNHLSFSPDGRYFASGGFDKKVKVWDGRTGKFVATLSGHVGAVYQSH